MRVVVDLQESAVSFANAAEVEVSITHAAAGGLAGGMKDFAELNLDQVAPGQYAGDFTPTTPGLYLVRARRGSDTISATYVHEVSTEAATGSIDIGLLELAAAAPAGSFSIQPATLDFVTHSKTQFALT